MESETGFDVSRFAAAARGQIRTETGQQRTVLHLPLACVLADYCATRGIDQAALLRELGADAAHPLSLESFRRLALVTINVSALAHVLSSMTRQEDDVA